MEKATHIILKPLLEFIWKSKKTYSKYCNDAAKDFNLTENEIDVLLFLINNPDLNTAMDAVRYRSISKSLVSKSVNSLLEKDYLVMQKDMDDKRHTRLTLTKKAHMIADDLKDGQTRFYDLLKNSVSEEEFEEFSRIIHKFSLALSENMKEEK